MNKQDPAGEPRGEKHGNSDSLKVVVVGRW